MANEALSPPIRPAAPGAVSMRMALATVRPAVVTDVDEILRIQATTWSLAYAELVPPSALAELDGERARQAWTAAIAAADGHHHVLVAAEGEHTVGFCAATAPGQSAPPADNGRSSEHRELGERAWGEINTLLVEPRWGRRGHAGRLLAGAAAALQAGGARYGLAWIPEPDQASRQFYDRAGWQPDGAARALDTGDGVLREIRVTGSLDLRLRD
jgi:GNAT superfamily N-acetyltransferase